MMFNISPDSVQRRNIYLLCLVLFVGLFIYAFFWVKYKLKMPLFKGKFRVPLAGKQYMAVRVRKTDKQNGQVLQ